jgi:hypothetical protein
MYSYLPKDEIAMSLRARRAWTLHLRFTLLSRARGDVGVGKGCPAPPVVNMVLRILNTTHDSRGLETSDSLRSPLDVIK